MPAVVFLFLLLFLLIWAGGAWIGPFGPLVWASAWLPFLLVGLILGLVILAVAEPRDRRRRPTAREAREPTDEERLAGAAMVYGAFFWILMLLLLVAIIAAYAD